MKKLTKLFGFASAVAMLAVSCTKEANYEGALPEGRQIEAIVIASGDATTKTELNGASVKWSTGDKIEIIEVATPTGEGEVKKTAKESGAGTSSDGNATMAFGTTFTEVENATFEYYGVYPSSAYHSDNGVGSVALNTPATQYPTASSFDGAADLLLAKKIDNGTTQAGTLNMQFARVVGIGKMTVKNLGTNDPVTKIRISAIKESASVNLAGRTNFDLKTGEPTSNYASNTQEKAIILDYTGKTVTANGTDGMVAYFACYPFSLAAGDSFTVDVETATQVFTRTVTLTGAQTLAINAGKASSFSVNMTGITGLDKAFDGCYAFLEYADVESVIGTSYSNQSVTKAHGDKWDLNAVKASGSIGIQKDNTGSYIKLPDMASPISSVIITLQDAFGKTLNIDSTQSANDGGLASVETTAEGLVYTIDLSSESVYTAYIHAKGGQPHFAKIEVYAGTDTRTALAAPTGVTTELNASVANSIDVSWNAVDNAGSYVVTLAPGAGDTVQYTTTETSCTVPGLEYNTEYMIAVKAIPADLYVYKESPEADGADVTTGATSGPQWVKTAIADIEDGSLIVIVDETTGKAMPNNNGTSSAPSATAVSISSDKTKLAEEPNAALQWTLKVVTGGYSFKTGDDYLYVTNTNNGVRVGSEERKVFEAYNNSGVTFLKNTSGSDNRYIGVYNDQDWRCYTSINNNIKNTVTVFYVKQDTRNAAPISWSESSATAYVGQSFTAPTFSNSESLAVTYASSVETVATINASGVVSIVGEGTTKISATFTATSSDTYKTTTAEYTLTVVDNRETVAAPTFSPEAGEVAANTSVTISTTTPDATIYYTTNPTTAFSTTTWTQGNTVTIDAAKTIRAVAVKDGWKDSAEASAAYTVAGSATTHYYEKVTVAPADWSGTYLIVNTDNNIAFDGSKTQDTGATFAVTISAGKIESTADIDAKSFTIGTTTGGYYIQSSSGKYLSGTSGSNKTNYGDSMSLNTISLSDGDVTITSNTSVLRYNSGSTLFRYYKSATYTSQKAIQLYKLN